MRALALFLALPLTLRAVCPPSPYNPTLDNPITDAAQKASIQQESDCLETQPLADVTKHRLADTWYGAVPASSPRVTRSVSIDTNRSRWQPLGLYAAPGERITLTVPSALAGRGFRLRINAHTDDERSATEFIRLPEVHRNFNINSTTIQAASPFGGSLFIDLLGPPAPRLGVHSVTVAGAVEQPVFILGTHTNAQWNGGLKQRGAPWAVLASPGLIILERSDRALAVTDPEAVMSHWQQVLDIEDGLFNHREAVRSYAELYNRDLVDTWGHAGYPYQVNWGWPNPLDLNRIRSTGAWGDYHEIGHNHQPSWSRGWWALDGTVEVTVNFFSTLVLRTLNPNSNDSGWRWVLSPSEVRNRALAAQNAGRKFYLGASNSEQLAFFLALFDAFGWEATRRFMAGYERDYRDGGQTPPSTQQQVIDQWVIRYSREAGRNLAPYFELWNLIPTAAAKSQTAQYPDWILGQPVGTPTRTPALTRTGTPQPTRTASPTASGSFTPTRTSTRTWTWTATRSATPSATPTVTRTATASATGSFTPSATPSEAGTSTFTPTPTDSSTVSETPASTEVVTDTPSPTQSSSWIESATASPSATASSTRTTAGTASPSPTLTVTRSATRTATPSATSTSSLPSPTRTATRSATRTATRTRTPLATFTRTPTRVPTVGTRIVDDFAVTSRYNWDHVNLLGQWTDDDGSMLRDQNLTGVLELDSRMGGYWYTVFGPCLDASAYAGISFDIRGLAGGETFVLNVQDKPACGAPVHHQMPSLSFVTLSINWQRVDLSFAALGVDPSRLYSLVLESFSPNARVRVDNIRLLGSMPASPSAATMSLASAGSKGGERPEPKQEQPQARLSAGPNPAKDWAVLRFTLPEAGRVKVYVSDLGGSGLKEVDLGWLPAGEGRARLDLRGLAGGVLLLNLQLDPGTGPRMLAGFKLAVVK